MAWNLSTGMVKALLATQTTASISINESTISFGDGDGSVVSGADTINDSGNGLADFLEGDWVLIIGGTNNNIMVKVLASAAGKLEIPATSITAGSAAQICLISLGGGGSVMEVLKNGTIDLRSGIRPASGADIVEAGTELLNITLNGNAFVAGEATNGLNLGVFSGLELKRAVDPITGVTEVWKGAGLAAASTGTAAGHARWYGNAKVTGASTSAIRMDGVVSTSGGDINMVNGTTIVESIDSIVSDVTITLTGI